MVPGQPLGEEGEHYLALSPALIEALKRMASMPPIGRDAERIVRLLIRVATIDPVSGDLVIGVKFLRELGDGEQ